MYGNPILSAAYYGHPQCVNILIEIGADINLPCGKCGSPLQSAVCGDHIEVVNLLLEKGANVNEHHGYASHEDTHEFYRGCGFLRSSGWTESYEELLSQNLLLDSVAKESTRSKIEAEIWDLNTTMDRQSREIKACHTVFDKRRRWSPYSHSDDIHLLGGKVWHHNCGSTPLQAALRMGHYWIATELIAAGACLECLPPKPEDMIVFLALQPAVLAIQDPGKYWADAWDTKHSGELDRARRMLGVLEDGGYLGEHDWVKSVRRVLNNSANVYR